MEIKLLYLLIVSSVIESIISKITIISPKALKDKFKSPIAASYSNFGKIPYGYTIVGRIYLDPNNKEADMACNPLTSITLPKNPSIDKAPIVMIDRGNCKFVEKVQNVENIGGHLALIIDNVPNQDPEHVVMSDDKHRHGTNIHIPGVLISYEDGAIIKEFYIQNKDNEKVLDSIIFEIEFEMEHSSNKVNYSIYFSSEYFNIYKTIKELYHFQKHLSNSTRLRPHYVTNQGTVDEGKEQDNCVSSGRYCVSPRYDLNITDGRIILRENLRQKCIYEFTNESTNQTNLYWDYMIAFYDNCIGNSTEAKDFTDLCSIKTMMGIGVNYFPVELCIIKSFGEKGIAPENEKIYLVKDNALFKADREEKLKHNIFLIPTILINNRTFWGSWSGENIFEALCAAFKTKPQVCYDEGAFLKENNTGMSLGTMAAIVVIVILFNLIIFFVCRKYIKRKIADKVEDTDINHKINTVVTSYLSLKETK